jgi:hypothetical protein
MNKTKKFTEFIKQDFDVTKDYKKEEINMDKQKMKEFEALATPLYEWLIANTDPHTSIIIDWDSMRVVSDEIGIPKQHPMASE